MLKIFYFQGDEGFERHIDHLFEMTAYLVEQLKAHSDKFELLTDEPECTNVCFWYVPYRLRTMKSGPERHKILGEVCIASQLQGSFNFIKMLMQFYFLIIFINRATMEM